MTALDVAASNMSHELSEFPRSVVCVVAVGFLRILIIVILMHIFFLVNGKLIFVSASLVLRKVVMLQLCCIKCHSML